MQKASFIFLTLLALSVMTACGPMYQGPDMQDQNIDSGLAKYLSEFQSQGAARGISTDASHLTMTFSESMPSSSIQGTSILAYCQRSSKGQDIVVKGSSFNAMSVSDREHLIFHELGHCLLGLRHDNARETALDYFGDGFVNNVPSSIMNELHFGAWLYSPNRVNYLNRLFNSIGSQLFYNGPSQFDNTIYN